MKTKFPSAPLPDFSDEFVERLYKKIDKEAESPCWVFMPTKYRPKTDMPGSQHVKLVSYKNKTYAPQRILWKLVKGEDPVGHVLRRTCNNPRCVNPDHYYKQEEECKKG